MQTADRSKFHAGKNAYHGGLSAEDAVARHYQDNGYTLLAERWRGSTGELDLVFDKSETLIFVEVKKARRFETAALRISMRQRQRILEAASEFAAAQPRGQLTDMRFDVALVNDRGEIKTLSNALHET